MKKSLLSYIFLIFLIITFLAGTYIYATGKDFVFKQVLLKNELNVNSPLDENYSISNLYRSKIQENITTISDINNSLSEVTNQIDQTKVKDFQNAVISKYKDVVNNIGIHSNKPTTP